MAFRFYPRKNRAQRRRLQARDLAVPLSGLPPLEDAAGALDSPAGVLARETARRLSEFRGHHSEPESDLSDVLGNVTPRHKGLD